MKYLLLILFVASSVFAQSDDYYDSADGKYGPQLKSALHVLVKGHRKYPYTSSGTDTWDIIKVADRDTNNTANVSLIYSGWLKNGEDEYAGGSGYNREHIWAKSHGFPSEGDTAYTDVHHLRACDVSVNSRRSNKDFDNGGSQVVDGDGTLNCYTDSDSWEPRPEVKGDVARMMFYMATRYEGGDGYDLELVDYTGTSGSSFGKLSTLLEWNRQDPPDDYERARNDAVESFQYNRNPFIDQPEFVDKIYNQSELLVDKVTHLNGYLVLVEFNKDVNHDYASNLANYTLDRGMGNPTAVVTNYEGDAKKVLLTYYDLEPLTRYVLQVSNVRSASNQTIAEGSPAAFKTTGTTPVELTAFTAVANDNVVNLQWETATEVNNKGFEIERKTSNRWEVIAFIDGFGTSTEIHKYSFSDNNTTIGKISYRLKQLDFSGDYNYSDVVNVEILPKSFTVEQNYPNPFNPSTNIKFNMATEDNVSVEVFNILGQKVSTLVNERLQAGVHTVQFNAENLPSGLYIYTVTCGATKITNKMTLLK